MIGNKEMGTGFIIESIDGESQSLGDRAKYIPPAVEGKVTPIPAPKMELTKKFQGAHNRWRAQGAKS